MKNVFLCLDSEIVGEAPEGYNLVIVRSFPHFVNYVTVEGVPDIVSLNYNLEPKEKIILTNFKDQEERYYQQFGLFHDLEDESPFAVETYPSSKTAEEYMTGLDAAKWLIRYCIKNDIPMPNCRVHCTNDAKRQEIINCINGYTTKFENYHCCI